MRRERPSLSEFIERALLGPINAVFLLFPALLLAIELTSFAALRTATPNETIDLAARSAPPAASRPEPRADEHEPRSPTPDSERETRLPAPASTPPPSGLDASLLGYGP